MAKAPQLKTYTEYRVLSSRVGNAVTVKTFRSARQVADRIGRLTSPEPWRFYGSESDRLRDGDALACCQGTYHDECACGGYTVAQKAALERERLPPIEWIRVETRTVTRHPWLDISAAFVEPTVQHKEALDG
jgi:hypothetical protein